MTKRTGPWLVLAGVVVVALFIGMAALLFTWISSTSAPATVPYSRFLDDVAAGGVTRVVQQGTTLEVSGRDGDYAVNIPTILTDVYGEIQEAARGGGAAVPEFVAKPVPDTSRLGLVVTVLLPSVVILILVLVLLLLARSARRERARGLIDRLRELDEAQRAGLITDDERARQRARILGEV